MRLSILAIVAVTWPVVATAAPSADLVVVWAPNRSIAPVETVARELGAAVVDRSPPRIAAPPSVAPLVRRGIDAYDALQFAAAATALDQALDVVDRTGAAGLTPAELSDLFLYRGLVQTQLGNPAGAWDELITAIAIDPARILDPSRFAPRVVSEVERARVAVTERAIATLAIDVPPTCSLMIDGVASGGTFSGRVGVHWVTAACTDRMAWGARITITGTADHVAVGGAPFAPLDDAEVLVQARVAAARSVVIAEVRGTIAIARLVGIDGRERDRRTVTVAADLAPLADAVRILLTPHATPTRWYRSRWVWAAGAAAIAAAILIPITAALAKDATMTTANIKPENYQW